VNTQSPPLASSQSQETSREYGPLLDGSGNRKIYLADRSNSAVDIVDAEKDIFVDRVTGFAGATGTNGAGPNGVLVTPNRKLFAGDGNSKLQVADVDPDSPNYLKFMVPNPGCTTNCGVDTADPSFPGANNATMVRRTRVIAPTSSVTIRRITS